MEIAEGTDAENNMVLLLMEGKWGINCIWHKLFGHLILNLHLKCQTTSLLNTFYCSLISKMLVQEPMYHNLNRLYALKEVIRKEFGK